MRPARGGGGDAGAGATHTATAPAPTPAPAGVLPHPQAAVGAEDVAAAAVAGEVGAAKVVLQRKEVAGAERAGADVAGSAEEWAAMWRRCIDRGVGAEGHRSAAEVGVDSVMRDRYAQLFNQLSRLLGQAAERASA